MTSLELLAALVKRYNLGNHRLDTLADTILQAIQDDETDALKYKQVVSSLAHKAQIILEPLDTFAARAHDAIQAKAMPVEGAIHGIAREQAETIAERERQLMVLMRDVHALIGEHYQALPPSSPDDAPRLLDTLKVYILDLLHCEVEAQREFLRPATPEDDLTALAHEVHAMLPNGYRAPWPAERYTPAEILKNVRSFLQTYGASGTYPVRELTDLAEYLSRRYSLALVPLDTLPRRVLQHLSQMERDAAEAHSAAEALGVEVKDLADVAKTLGTLVKDIRTIAEIPDGEDILVRMREVARQRNIFQANAVDALDRLARVEAHLQAVVEALPPGHRGTEPITTEHAHKVADLVRAFVRLHNDALALRDDELADARKALNHNGCWTPLAELIRDLQRQRDLYKADAEANMEHLSKSQIMLQAINEALPADLRHTDDLAAAIRTLVLTAETRYGQWDELARETAPAVQTVAALRYALESRSLRLALARELYDADDNLLELLETADAHQMTETLMATLATNRAAPEYPPLPKPSALARTLEGPAKVAYFNHSRRAGRVEAIGEDLIRFYPVEGDPVTLNATRRDLEVYHLTADELAAEIAKVEARKTPPTESPPAAVADDDIPF